ncbi:MAG: glycosyltransferase family 4 protein [Planctomycetota bacterium]
MRITFLSPHLTVSGGVRIICEYARRLSERKHRVNLIYRDRRYPFLRNFIQRFIKTVRWVDLKGVNLKFVRRWDEKYIPEADVIFATTWQTARLLNNCSFSRGKKFHLIQHLPVEGVIDDTPKARETISFPLHKIVTSRWLQQRLMDEYGQKGDYIPNGINQSQFFPVKKTYGTKRIGMLHHTAALKGFNDGLKAFELVRKSIPDAKLVLFGVRHRRPTELKSSDVEYRHNPPQQKLREIYSSCDVFICPSWYEGVPLPPLEAMACKTALATTDNGGCREYAIHNQTALVSPIKNPEALAENVIKLLSDQAFLTRISENGYKMAQQFNWQSSVNKMEKLLILTLLKS